MKSVVVKSLIICLLALNPLLAVAEQNEPSITRDEMAIIAARGTYAFSTGNIDNPKMLFSKNFVRHEQQYLTPEADLENIAQLIESQRQFYKVDDIQTEPVEIIIEGDMAVVRWIASVDRTDAAVGEEDLPKHMEFEGVTISRFENGKIAEQWVYYDSNLVLTLTRLRYKNYFETTSFEAASVQ